MGIGLIYGAILAIVIVGLDYLARKSARRRREKRWPDLKQK